MKKNSMSPTLQIVIILELILMAMLLEQAVPSSSKIVIFKDSTEAFWNLPTSINLPFKISFLWDVPIVVALFFITKYFFNHLKNLQDQNDRSFRIIKFGLFMSLILGVMFAIQIGIKAGIITSLIISSLFGIFMTTFSLVSGILFGLTSIILISTQYGLFWGAIGGTLAGTIFWIIPIIGSRIRNIILGSP